MTPVDESYTKLCKFDELNEGNGRRFIVNETEVAVFKIENILFSVCQGLVDPLDFAIFL